MKLSFYISVLYVVSALMVAVPLLPAYAQQPLNSATGITPDEAPAEGGSGILLDVRPAVEAARKAMEEGDFAKAERLYTLILKMMPDMHYIRLEYAAAARHAGQGRRAREILTPLDVDALPPGQRSAYRHIAWGHHAFNFSVSPRMMLDSNINGGPQKRTITIGNQVYTLADETLPSNASGVGGTLAMQALWQPQQKMALAATAILDGDFYENSRYNDTRLSLSAGPRVIVGNSLLRLNVLGGTRYYGNEHLEDEYGGQAAATFNIIPATPITFSASRREFSGTNIYGMLRDRSQTTYAASLNAQGIFPWEKGDGWLNLAIERENWERDIEDNTGYRVGFGLTFPPHKWVGVDVMLNATRRLYDNPITLLGQTRAEWRIEPSIRAELKALKLPFGTPYVQYSYINNLSNISLTDYDQHRMTTGLIMANW